jgi:tetratricopeptide (TPR) repeat protein
MVWVAKEESTMRRHADLGRRYKRASILVLLLALGTVVPARAQQTSSDDWVGKAVVPKARQLIVKDAQTGTERPAAVAVYRVQEAQGDLLSLATAGHSGWARRGQVVLLERAVPFFTSQIEASPGEPFNYTMRALVLHAQGVSIDRVLSDLNEALRLDPRDPLALGGRGVAWLGRGEHDKAIADFNEAIRLEPREASHYFNRADAWRAKRDFDRAIADYNEIIRRDPELLPAYFARAVVRGEKGDIDHAIADLDAAIKLNPRWPDAYVARAAGWKQKRELDKAIADLNTAIKLEPKSATAYHERGLLWSEKKELDKAIADYSDAIRLEPANAVGYCNRGFAWKTAKEFDNAIADFTEAIRRDAKDSDAYCGRGWSWREKHDYAKALADFQGALRLDPRDACALDGQAWIWATCPDSSYRNGGRAVEVAIEACELTRWKQAYCIETLAAAYAEVGDFAAAVKWQTKAVELEADPAEKDEYRGHLKLYQDKKPFRDSGR